MKYVMLAALLFQLSADADPYRGLVMPGTDAPCCGGNDCAPLPDSSVREVTGGFEVMGWGFVPERETQLSFDNHFHLCQYPLGTRRCFLRPGMGA